MKIMNSKLGQMSMQNNTKATERVSLVEQELPTLPEHIGSVLSSIYGY